MAKETPKEPVKMAFFKLKEASGSYFDKKSGLHLINKTPGKIPANKVSKEVTARLKGHIVQIDEDEYNKLMENAEQADAEGLKEEKIKSFEEMTKDELNKYADENLEGDDLEAYKESKNNKARIEFLTAFVEKSK